MRRSESPPQIISKRSFQCIIIVEFIFGNNIQHFFKHVIIFLLSIGGAKGWKSCLQVLYAEKNGEVLKKTNLTWHTEDTLLCFISGCAGWKTPILWRREYRPRWLRWMSTMKSPTTNGLRSFWPCPPSCFTCPVKCGTTLPKEQVKINDLTRIA